MINRLSKVSRSVEFCQTASACRGSLTATAFEFEATTARAGGVADRSGSDGFVWRYHFRGVQDWLLRRVGRHWRGAGLSFELGVEFGVEVREEVALPVKASFFVALGETDDVDGRSVADGGGGGGVGEDLAKCPERGIGRSFKLSAMRSARRRRWASSARLKVGTVRSQRWTVPRCTPDALAAALLERGPQRGRGELPAGHDSGCSGWRDRVSQA
jgi:hypothetical protein